MGKSILLIGLSILIFLAPIKFGMPIGFDTHQIWQMGIVILFTLWLVWGISSGKVKIRYSFLDAVILIFLISSVISAFRAPNIHKAHLCLVQYFAYALTYLLVLNILEDEKVLLWALVIPAVLISLYAIYQRYIGLPETREFASQYFSQELPEYVRNRLASNRVFSTFIYPNTLAGYLFLCIPIAIWIKNRQVRVLIILLMLYALFLTFYSGSGAIDKIRNTLIFRWENWTAGFRMIKNYPVFGVGTYNFSVFYPIYKLDIAEEVQNAHNNFLQIWAEQGIIGFLAFCAIWAVVLKKGPVPFFPFIIHNLIDFDWYVPGLTVIAWVFMGLIVWRSGRYREKVFAVNRLILIPVLFVFFFVLLHLGRSLVADRYLQEAKRAYSNKNSPLTEVLAKVSINMDRDNPDPYFLLGWYKKAIRYNPYNSSYYYNIGLFEKAVEYYPTNPFYRLQLARFYETNNQPDLALTEYRRCLELNDKIKREYETSGKMLKHLILAPGIIEEINKKILHRG